MAGGYLAGLGQLSDVGKTAANNLGRSAVSGSTFSNPQAPSNDPSSDPIAQLIQMRSQAQSVAQRPGISASVAGAGINPNPIASTGVGGAGPAAAPVSTAGGLSNWIAQAERAMGVSGPAWDNGLALIAQHESSGDPNAINNWDSNAAAGHPSQGLMQTIPSTFQQYVPANLASLGILNPVANIAAAIGYINSRYGGINNVPGVAAVAQGRPYVGY